MDLTRRTLLKSGIALAGLPALTQLAFAEPGTSKDTLVIVFQRGGCDGLSLLAPTNDPDYVADRAPDLRVRDDGAKPGRTLRQAFAPSIDFRLHPEAAMLGELYDSKNLAFIHAAGLVNGTRSHFVAQDLMDRGLSDGASLHTPIALEGWLTRLLIAQPSTAPAVTTSPAIPASLAFHQQSLAIPDLRAGLGWPGAPQVKTALASLYGMGADPFSRAASQTFRDVDLIDAKLPKNPDGKVMDYLPANNAAYEENESGRALKTVARLIRADLGLSVAGVDIGGWDHHDNLGGRFSGLVGQFSRNLVAFWNDVANHHDRLTVVVMTEFGRRLRTNKSNGTDHGHGGVMMVLSGNARGGEIYGQWPGLAAHQLDNGVDLAVTTDYRTVLAEVISRRLAFKSPISTIFPTYAPVKPLGIFRSV